MTRFSRDKDTICATITAPGRAGIAVVRVSGDEAESIIRKLCEFLPPDLESHRVYYGFLCDCGSQSAIDEVLVTYFKRGRSFTGEPTFEISCHGNPLIASEILNGLCQAGARMAERGEFTYRAFFNGRIDLVQAEGVLEIIQSRTKKAAQLATRQLQGDLSKRLREILGDLTWILANLEADIDFASEDIVVAGDAKLAGRAELLLKYVQDLIGQMRQGRILKNGYQVALMGRTNAGKSSLLNALVGEERAIVTEIHGTTRDFVHGEIALDGVLIDVIDTAGFRSGGDEVEAIGIERAMAKVEEVDRVFYVVDGSVGWRAEDSENLAQLPTPKLTVIWNKMDLAAVPQVPIEHPTFAVSARDGSGLEAIRTHLRGLVGQECAEDAPALCNARHFEELGRVSRSLEIALQMLREGQSPDLIALELQAGLRCLHELLGIVYDDQVMDRVFQEFCIGK